jgi:hypothetical protein
MNFSFARTARLVSGVAIIGVASFFILNQIEKWALIKESNQEAAYAYQDARELIALGFSENDELIDLMHERKKLFEERADTLGKRHLVLYGRHGSSNEEQELEQLIVINKKMLRSYVRDLQDYRKLGVPNDNHIVQFAQKKIVRLTFVLAELERQQLSAQDGVAHSAEHMKRLKKLVATNRKSLKNYQKELSGYRNHGMKLDDPKMAFLKTQLTDQLRSTNELERMMAQS